MSKQRSNQPKENNQNEHPCTKNHQKDNPCKDKHHMNHHCNGCICDKLRRLNKCTEVDVFLSGGKILEDVIFIKFDNDNCCAIFKDEETEPGSILIVDCEKIDAIRIEAEED